MAKRKVSAAQKARLKALRKKHGLGEFRKAKVKRTSHKVSKMAKKSKRRSVRKTLLSGVQKPLFAGVTYAFVQPFVSQFLSRFNVGIQDELVQIFAAVLAKNMFKNQIVNNWADAAIIINAASLSRAFASKLNIGGSGSIAVQPSVLSNNALPVINT